MLIQGEWSVNQKQAINTTYPGDQDCPGEGWKKVNCDCPQQSGLVPAILEDFPNHDRADPKLPRVVEHTKCAATGKIWVKMTLS